MLSVHSFNQYHSSLYKGATKLFQLILSSETPEIISISCKIATMFLKHLDLSKLPKSNTNAPDFFDSIFEKLGKLWVFKRQNFNLNTFSEKESNLRKKYYVIIHLNSPEIDYQFLVNSLYHWEEKYPSKLSIYKYGDPEKVKTQKDIMEKLEKNNLSVRSHVLKNLTYFNPMKVKTSKVANLDQMVDERLVNIRKSLAEAQKQISVLTNPPPKKDEKGAEEEKKEDNNVTGNLEGLKERFWKVKCQELYHLRIKSHIKTAELIGEMASLRIRNHRATIRKGEGRRISRNVPRRSVQDST